MLIRQEKIYVQFPFRCVHVCVSCCLLVHMYVFLNENENDLRNSILWLSLFLEMMLLILRSSSLKERNKNEGKEKVLI